MRRLGLVLAVVLLAGLLAGAWWSWRDGTEAAVNGGAGSAGASAAAPTSSTSGPVPDSRLDTVSSGCALT